jgi:2-polyprenyl-3-methyl-5-hydroxy-6-metoxy-1,4-benzoquinol methylase
VLTTKNMSLQSLFDLQASRNPKHRAFLEKRFASMDSAEIACCNELVDNISRLAGDRLEEFLEGYDFICKIQFEEEIFFRRNKRYRLTKFSDALEQVYANKPYMLKYMRGLLISQVFWSNHTKSIDYYSRVFLAQLEEKTTLLEIGPGHGLLLARAVDRLSDGSVTAWDISEASLEDTRKCLQALGVTKSFKLEAKNLFDPNTDSFDAIVFSEVLEHVEEPAQAMAAIRNCLNKNGKLFVNVPINSPAPDHLFLIRSPEEAVEFVESCGFSVLQSGFYPATNYTLEQCRKHDLTISVCMIAGLA